MLIFVMRNMPAAKSLTPTDPRAPREGRSELYYKFYNDEGMKLVTKKYPQYLVNHEMLGLKLVGVPQNLIVEARQPQPRLQELLKKGPNRPTFRGHDASA